MEYLNKIDWNYIWSIIKDIVLPHSGTLILNIIIFSILGFLISFFYVLILHKKNVLKRIPKYYNWAVKLYIPMLIIAFVILFVQIGFITGVYKILKKENNTIVTSVYSNLLEVSFESEESKNEFITKLQQSAKEAKNGSNAMIESLKITTAEYNTGYSVIDENKNKLTNYLIEKYGNDIYNIALYAMLNSTGTHTNIDTALSYEKFSDGMDFLLDVGYKDIERAIKDKLLIWYNSLIYSQYKTIIFNQLTLVLITILFPLIEFLIYKKWIEPKY